MGLFDKAKDLIEEHQDEVKEFIEEHEDQVTEGVDRVAEFVDDKTGGKHSDKIDSATEKAKDAVAKLSDK
jgi:hypothetical protein